MRDETGAGNSAPASGAAVERTPWERPDAAFPVDLFRSWLHCMTEPVTFFRSVDRGVPIGRPLLFFFVIWILGSGLGTLSADATFAGWYAANGIEAPGTMWSLFLFFLSPFIGAVSLTLYIAFTHLGVRLFVRDPAGIGVTARGLCYASAPQLLAVVPFLGWLVGPLWSLFLAVVGVRELHRATTGSATAAVIVPPLAFSIGLGMLLFFLVLFFTLAVGSAA